MERKPQIFVRLSFTELCGSQLSGLHSLDNMAVIHWVKNRLKTERQAESLWDTNPCSNICDLNWELIYRNKWHSGTSEISSPPELALGTLFHARNGTIVSQYFYLLIEKALGRYFQVRSLYYQAAQCNQKTLILVYSRWQVMSEKAKRG